MNIVKMNELGIKEAKVYKVTEYSLWNDLKVYLKHRIDTTNKEIYTLYLEDFCLCDISPESAEDEKKFFEIFEEIIDDDCILDYMNLAEPNYPDPEILLRKNLDKYLDSTKEWEEYQKTLDPNVIHSLSELKEKGLKYEDIK